MKMDSKMRAMGCGYSSGLLPKKAPAMIAEKGRVVLSLQTSEEYNSCQSGTVASHHAPLCMIRPCSTYAVTVTVPHAQPLACLYGNT